MRTYGKLREKIRAKFGTIGAFAEAWGKDRSTVSNKLNGITPWTNADIEETCELVGISIDQVHDYFFYE
jgi:hypothetical protein